jgi:cellobiose phosphorylase
VISGVATEAQAKSSLAAMKRELATPYGLMLCAPPFEKTPRHIMDGVVYNKGIKENGGIFNHPQAWAVMAECQRGNGDQGYEYYRAYMPSAYNTRAELREIEPYVHSQTTYASCNSNAGKSRVPLLTGTAAWSYFSAVQSILGVRPEYDGLRVDPCIPSHWPEFAVERVLRGKKLSIRVQNPERVCRGVAQVVVDGSAVAGNLVPYERLQDGSVLAVTLSG